MATCAIRCLSPTYPRPAEGHGPDPAAPLVQSVHHGIWLDQACHHSHRDISPRVTRVGPEGSPCPSPGRSPVTAAGRGECDPACEACITCRRGPEVRVAIEQPR